MASSQVEMASTAPFGCVLRDHNRRDTCRESNARATQAAFQKNLNSLVRNHLPTCISVSSTSASNDKISNNSQDQNIENVERDDGCSPMSPRQSRVLDRWADRQGGKEAMATVDRQSQEAELMSVPSSAPSSTRTSTSMKEGTLSRTDSLADISNRGVGASSLVQIWEKRLNLSNSFKMSSNGGTETSRSNSGLSFNENENIFDTFNEYSASNEYVASNQPVFEKQLSRESEAGDFVCVDERYDTGPVAEDSIEDTHSDESATSDARRNLDAKEREREREKVRVVDIIKRLTMTAKCPLSSPSDDNDHDQQSRANASQSRERDRERTFGVDQTEQLHKGFSQVISSPRMIRGRQAFADLLMQLERDRHRELDTLVDRRAVSRFSNKGRIQSMLRLKLLQRGMAGAVGQEVPRRKPATSQVNKLPQGSAIMHLREKFSACFEQASTAQSDAASTKIPQREVVKDTSVHPQNSSTSNMPSESTPSCNIDITEQKNATRVQTPLPRATNDPREVVSMSSKVTCQETSSVATNTSTQASKDLREEASPSSKVSSEGTSSVATNNLLAASEDLRDEASLSLKVTSQGSSPMARNTTPHASEDLREEPSPSLKVTLQGTSPMARSTSPHGSEDLREEASPSLEVNLQGTSPMARKTSPHASEDLHEEASPSSEVTLQGTSSEAINNLPHTSEYLHEEASPGSEVIWQGTSSEARNLDVQETADANTSLVGWDENDIEEQLEDDYQYYGDYTYDWINEISRPRSYWEDLRKAWYQEMLNSNSGKGEIRQLIERSTVSNFLASDFRDRIDRLMVSRLEIQAQPDGSQEGEDNDINHDRTNLLVSFLQQHHQNQQQEELQPACSQEEQQVQEQEHQEDQNMTEEDDEEEDDDDEEGDDDNGGEERSLISAQYQEASDDFYHCTSLQPSPSHMTSWSYQDIEVGDNFGRAASTSPPRHFPSHSYYPNSRQGSPSPSYHQNHHHYSSPSNNPSIEMEFIYDMRGQMEQLYREMSELRKVIKSCVDMQLVMQQSMMQEVHSGQAKRKRSANGLPKKGNCCICHEVKVDSLFYRCGHMCTCLKCAHELQWNSGKCPICRAPIVDVVKAQMDY